MAQSVSKYPSEIIRVCSYHRHDFDLVLVRSPPHVMDAVRGCLQHACDAPPTASLGALTRLPTELHTMILRNLDSESFFRSRQVNRAARVTATSVREYESVVAHGLEGLRSLLRVHLAHRFTMMHLFEMLCMLECYLCGFFVGFLFLPTATRCCFACIEASPRLAVRSVFALDKITKMPANKLRRNVDSIMRTVPGIYSMTKKSSKRPQDIVGEHEARRTMITQGLHDEVRALDSVPPSREERHRYMASTAFPWYDSTTFEAEDGISCKGCQVRLEATLGIMDAQDRDRVFSRAGFLTHFLQCREAQELWDSSESGTKPTSEPNVTRSGGFLHKFDGDGRLR